MHDIAIAGGGPAGLSTAIAAKLAGFRDVVVLESRPAPIDKACGEGLLPKACQALEALGVAWRQVEHYRFFGIRYLDRGTVLQGPFSADGRVFGVGMARLELTRALVDRAQELGVQLRWNAAVRGLLPQGFVTRDGPVHARFRVGADGLHSPVRRFAGLQAPPLPVRRPRRFGYRVHLAVRPWSPAVEVYWGPGCEAYVTPLGPKRIGVAVLTHGALRTPQERLLEEFEPLAKRLVDAPILGKLRGAGPFEQRAVAATQGQLALVGDAAGYFDAITGEGLGHAFAQAQAFAQAAKRGDLRIYEDFVQRHRPALYSMQAVLRFASHHRRLRGLAFAALRAYPSAFHRLLQRHASR